MSKKLIPPSFFVVGAQKAGTTTLHDWLAGEGTIAMPSIKETHFFSHDALYRKGIEWYLRQFNGGKDDGLTGEVDPDYMFYPETPGRIRKHVGKAKFIFIFRNPVDRAYSHYLMALRRTVETLAFHEALVSEVKRKSWSDELYMSNLSYMERGRYSEQVRRFQSVMPDSDFLFLRYEDLFSSKMGVATYERVCKFIGLGAPCMPFDIKKRSNPASEPRFRFISRLLYGRSSFKKAMGMLVPSDMLKLKLAMFIENANLTSIKKKEVGWKESVPIWVWEEAQREAIELGRLTGLDFSSWSEKVGI